MKIEDKVLDALNSLGSDSIEVARNLRDQKIKGIPYNAANCPVATFLRSKFPGWVITIYGQADGISINNDAVFRVQTPQAVLNFMQAFDKDQFPDLEE